MRRPLPLVLLLAMAVTGCSSTRSAVVHADGPLAGDWLMTVHPAQPRGIGSIRTVLTFAPAGAEGAFVAHSRPGAVRDVAGGVQAALASAAGGEAYARGALVHVYDGALVAAGDSLTVSGRLVTPNYGSLALTGGLRGGRLRGALRRAGTGGVVALFEAEPYVGSLPLADYAALVPAARAIVRERYYDPRELDSPKWTAFWTEAERRMGRAQDDLEAISQFSAAARSLSLSHFWLQRAVAVEIPSAPGQRGGGVSFDRRRDGVAVLTCRQFEVGQATPVIEAAFEEMDRLSPPALVVDLRSCSGGDLSAMLVAAHLLDEPAAAGLFLSNRWWATHDAPPARAEWDRLPGLAKPDLDTFFRVLADEGALVGRIEPSRPTYRGPVYVLTSGQTASAAEPLAHLLKMTGRATLVGAPTAGAMLSSTTAPCRESAEYAYG